MPGFAGVATCREEEKLIDRTKLQNCQSIGRGKEEDQQKDGRTVKRRIGSSERKTVFTTSNPAYSQNKLPGA